MYYNLIYQTLSQLYYYINLQRMLQKFRLNDIVWVKNLNSPCFHYWPAKIIMAIGPNNLKHIEQYDVIFFGSAEKNISCLAKRCVQSELIHFQNYIFNEKQSGIDLYNAFRQAKCEHRENKLKEESINKKSFKYRSSYQPKNATELADALTQYFQKTIEDIPIDLTNIGSSMIYEEKEFLIYYQRKVCQLINYFLNQVNLQEETKENLNEMKQTIKNIITKSILKWNTGS